MNPKPGSPEFNDQLLERLHSDSSLDNSDKLVIDRIETFSRNTVIYRISGPDVRLVAKAQLTKPSDVVANEFKVLEELEKRLNQPGARALSPIALYPELGVLITKEEQGESIRSFVDKGILAKADSKPRKMAEELMNKAAFGLYCFHRAFGISKENGGTEISRRYLDYSARNILVINNDHQKEVVLMDPPEFEERGPIYRDLGNFCFDLSRAGFFPWTIIRLPQNWLNHLKWRFLSSYFQFLERPLRPADLHGVLEGECARARQVLGFYTSFMQYPSWPVEFARFGYFGPIVLGYRSFYLNRSYRKIRDIAGLKPKSNSSVLREIRSALSELVGSNDAELTKFLEFRTRHWSFSISCQLPDESRVFVKIPKSDRHATIISEVLSHPPSCEMAEREYDSLLWFSENYKTEETAIHTVKPITYLRKWNAIVTSEIAASELYKVLNRIESTYDLERIGAWLRQYHETIGSTPQKIDDPTPYLNDVSHTHRDLLKGHFVPDVDMEGIGLTDFDCRDILFKEGKLFLVDLGMTKVNVSRMEDLGRLIASLELIYWGTPKFGFSVPLPDLGLSVLRGYFGEKMEQSQRSSATWFTAVHLFRHLHRVNHSRNLLFRLYGKLMATPYLEGIVRDRYMSSRNAEIAIK